MSVAPGSNKAGPKTGVAKAFSAVAQQLRGAPAAPIAGVEGATPSNTRLGAVTEHAASDHVHGDADAGGDSGEGDDTDSSDSDTSVLDVGIEGGSGSRSDSDSDSGVEAGDGESKGSAGSGSGMGDVELAPLSQGGAGASASVVVGGDDGGGGGGGGDAVGSTVADAKAGAPASGAMAQNVKSLVADAASARGTAGVTSGGGGGGDGDDEPLLLPALASDEQALLDDDTPHYMRGRAVRAVAGMVLSSRKALRHGVARVPPSTPESVGPHTCRRAW